MTGEEVKIVFEAPPGPGNECVFVEVEDDAGFSVEMEWTERADGAWELGPFYIEKQGSEDA